MNCSEYMMTFGDPGEIEKRHRVSSNWTRTRRDAYTDVLKVVRLYDK